MPFLRFKIVNPQPHRIVVKLRGELVMEKIDRLKKEVTKAIKAMPPNTKGAILAFEASEATYADSSSLAALVHLYELAKLHKIKAEIQNPDKYFSHLLRKLSFRTSPLTRKVGKPHFSSKQTNRKMLCYEYSTELLPTQEKL